MKIIESLLPVFVALGLLLLTPIAFADDGATGEKLYNMYCVQCHGTKGDGNGVNAAFMSVQPRSHIDKTEMSQRTDDELFKVIAEGGPAINKSVLMPAWKGNMSAEQINLLVRHVRKLCCSD